MKIVGFPALGTGLNAEMSGHFGHVEAFTLIQYNETTNEIVKTGTLTNAPHEQGGCGAPVMALKNAGAEEVVLGGIGMRPLMIFNQLGIKTYKGKLPGTVKENFDALVKGQLEPMIESTCSGGNH